MNIDERLKYAENRRDDSITNGTSYDCAYWNGYLDALKAVKDYRKASEVARETVEAIKKEVSKKEQYIGDLYGCGGFMIATTDLEDIIRRYMFDTYEEAELKKKYTEECDG